MKWLRANIGTVLFISCFIAVISFPSFKVTVIRGLMALGMFSPNFSKPEKSIKLKAGEAFLLTDTLGQQIDLNNLKGKVVFINFWASWCPPCLAEMPSLSRLYGDYRRREDIVFIFVDVDGKVQLSNTFLKQKGYQLPVYVSSGNIPRAFDPQSLPTTMIIDREGEVVLHHLGVADYDSKKVRKLIDGL